MPDARRSGLASTSIVIDNGPVIEQVASHLFIVLGGTGDLMRRKLLPALYHLRRQGYLGEDCLVLGVDVKDLSDAEYRAWAREALAEADVRADRAWCDECLFYRSLGT